MRLAPCLARLASRSFNQLVLPAYSSATVLAERLGYALANTDDAFLLS
jgi:hypothetical protein